MTNFQRAQKLLRGDVSAYTPEGKSYFIKAGLYGKTPAVGSIVYFYSSSLGRVSHVGLVTSVTKSGSNYFIKVVEGNTAAGTTFSRDGGEAAIKSYSFTESQVGGVNRINGFGTPAYGADTCTADEFIQEALSWVGYAEKDTAALKATDEQIKVKSYLPGDDNVTWFGRWYGRDCKRGSVYYTGQWCQMFISTCAYNACAAHVGSQSVKTGWYSQDGDWFYAKENGNLARDEWLYIGGRWYVFDGSGRMAKGWYKDSTGLWYYLADDGGMISHQWLEYNGRQYFFDNSGAMVTNAYVRSPKPVAPMMYVYSYVGSDGAWEPAKDTTAPPSGLDVVV